MTETMIDLPELIAKNEDGDFPRELICASSSSARIWVQMRTRKKRPCVMLDGFEGKMTLSKWAKISSCSRDIANRAIAALLDLGLLYKGQAGGRSTHYSISLDE